MLVGSHRLKEGQPDDRVVDHLSVLDSVVSGVSVTVFMKFNLNQAPCAGSRRSDHVLFVADKEEQDSDLAQG